MPKLRMTRERSRMSILGIRNKIFEDLKGKIVEPSIAWEFRNGFHKG